MKRDDEKERLITLSDLADRASLSVRTVQKHVAAGVLKVVKVGPHERPRVREKEAEKYLGLNDDK